MLTGQLALVFASAFTGMAVYINVVEQPARMALNDEAMIAEWKPSDHRGFAVLAGLALASALFGLLAFHASGDVRWLTGAIVIVSSWPYAFFILVPLNNRLLAAGPGVANPDSRLLARDWGLLEWGLSAIGLAGVCGFLWALN